MIHGNMITKYPTPIIYMCSMFEYHKVIHYNNIIICIYNLIQYTCSIYCSIIVKALSNNNCLLLAKILPH